MRLPRFRFTVRRMMVAVAIAGAALGSIELTQRRWRYLARVSRQAAFESNCLGVIREIEEQLGRPHQRIYLGCEIVDNPDFVLRHYRGRVATSVTVRRKSDRLARYPWLPVGPDPPEPE